VNRSNQPQLPFAILLLLVKEPCFVKLHNLIEQDFKYFLEEPFGV
jgi:hypothetical protein